MQIYLLRFEQGFFTISERRLEVLRLKLSCQSASPYKKYKDHPNFWVVAFFHEISESFKFSHFFKDPQEAIYTVYINYILRFISDSASLELEINTFYTLYRQYIHSK